MFQVTPKALVAALLWVLAALALQTLAVLFLCARTQLRWERDNEQRQDCHALWEQGLLGYLYGGDLEGLGFGPIGPRERRLFVPFLLRVLATMGGREGEAVRALYHRLGLSRGLGARLKARRPQARALAVLEVSSFRVEGHALRLLELLSDPSHHVAHAAAQGLAATGQLAFAEPVFTWVMNQERLQPGRQLEILERFGPGFMRWMERRLDERGVADPAECLVYAQLAASGRKVEEPSRLLAMLAQPDVDLLAAAIRALGALALPGTLPQVLAYADHDSWIIRAQVAKAIGNLSGAPGLGTLLALLCDPVFAVRHNAAFALTRVGPTGLIALQALAASPTANPRARELAQEAIQWLEPEARA